VLCTWKSVTLGGCQSNQVRCRLLRCRVHTNKLLQETKQGKNGHRWRARVHVRFRLRVWGLVRTRTYECPTGKRAKRVSIDEPVKMWVNLRVTTDGNTACLDNFPKSSTCLYVFMAKIYACICNCIYICICMYRQVYNWRKLSTFGFCFQKVYLLICEYIKIYVHIYIYIRIYAYIYIDMHMTDGSTACSQMCKHTCIHACMYIHVCIYTYV